MVTFQKVVIVLDNSGDWDEWFHVIKSRAKAAGIWEFIDPSIKKEDLPILTRPVLPLPQDVNPQKTLISHLTPEEVEELREHRDEWKERNREYGEQRSAIKEILILVLETVSRPNYTYLIGNESLHDMIVSLKERLAPADYARETEVMRQYLRLLTPSRDQNVNKWIKLWEITYTKGKELSIPVFDGKRPILDFISTIKERAPTFAECWTIRLLEAECTGKKLPDFYWMLESFRTEMCDQNITNFPP